MSTVISDNAATSGPIFSISATEPVANVSHLATYTSSFGFEPGEEYTGWTQGIIIDPYTQHPVPVVKLAGGVMLQSYPSPTGNADIEGFFLGSLMSKRRSPQPSCLVKQEGPYPVNPMIYVFKVGVDTSVLPGLEEVKAGMTGNRRKRRSNHQSNSIGPTRLLMQVRPEKYTLESLERLLLAALNPWMSRKREFFRLPYTIRFDLAKIDTEAKLVKYCVALLSAEGIALVNRLEASLVHGTTVKVNQVRRIEVDTVVSGEITPAEEPVGQP